MIGLLMGRKLGQDKGSLETAFLDCRFQKIRNGL